MILKKVYNSICILLIFWNISLIAALAKLDDLKIPFLSFDILTSTKQDKALIRDLKLLNYPPLPWMVQDAEEHSAHYDVIIIGAGMAGLTVGAALFQEGIYHIQLFDQNTKGCEGPWTNYARMKTLRSPKDLMGPALNIPHLTFHAWFEAQWGAEEWKQLGKIPNSMWMDYLNWYQQVLQLPVNSNCKLTCLNPIQNGFEATFEKHGQSFQVTAKKVILATGRAGFGGPKIPHFMTHLPPSKYAHTIDQISFDKLKDHKIGIIGAGASALDAAAVALEKGVKSVDILMRRSQLPNVNKFASLYYKSFSHGYYHLPPQNRWEFMCTAFDAGIPPPIDALKRLQGFENFRLRGNIIINQVEFKNSLLNVHTNQGTHHYDFLILGTGFEIDGNRQPELASFFNHIDLWKYHLDPELLKSHAEFGNFPFLGPHFEFLSRDQKDSSYLKNLYCFNYAATLSHGLLSSDIPAISIGAKRLAEGIAADFFIQNSDYYLDKLKNYQQTDFEQSTILDKKTDG